jgi:hypothetical protein
VSRKDEDNIFTFFFLSLDNRRSTLLARYLKAVMMQKGQANVKTSEASQGLHVVAKPIGPICNLNCDYCFYLEK